MVEDNRGDVLLMQEALRESAVAFDLEHIADGEQAVAYVRHFPAEARPRPELILLDLNLPRIDGWRVLEEIRSLPHFLNIPVAILSSSNAPADLRRAREFPNLIYIQKPPSFDALVKIGPELKQFVEGSGNQS